MSMLRAAIRTLLLAAAVLNSGLTQAADPPLSMRDIARMRHDRVPLEQIVEKATERGISFGVTPGVEKQLARLGFAAEQIEALKSAGTPQAKTDREAAEKAAAIVPGEGLKSTDAERDHVLAQITKITKLSGANLQPVTARHTTLWAKRDDHAAYLADIKKIERYFETKCSEPLRSGLDKRSAHVVLIRTRYDYEKWMQALFTEMPEMFAMPDTPGGEEEFKEHLLKKAPGLYTPHFVVICMEGFDDEMSHRKVAAAVGYMNLTQLIEPQRQDPLATGFADGAESLAFGNPSVMISGPSYHVMERDLGKDAQGWLNLVKQRMRTKKSTRVGDLLKMDAKTMLLPNYAEAWTLIGLLAKQPEKFGKLLIELRSEKEVLKAIEMIYGWDEQTLEKEWQKDVLARNG
jgi:hypothetical protein